MDKTSTLSIKNYIVRKMAVDLAVPEKTIIAVVDHQFASFCEAVKHKNSLELPGIGRWIFKSRTAAANLEKAKINLEKLNEKCINNTDARLLRKRENLQELITSLTIRLNA